MKRLSILTALCFFLSLSASAQSTYSSANQDSVNEPTSNKYQSGYVNDVEYPEDEMAQEEQEYIPEPVDEEQTYLENEVQEDPNLE